MTIIELKALVDSAVTEGLGKLPVFISLGYSGYLATQVQVDGDGLTVQGPDEEKAHA